jgi:hypothetical protein
MMKNNVDTPITETLTPSDNNNSTSTKQSPFRGTVRTKAKEITKLPDLTLHSKETSDTATYNNQIAKHRIYINTTPNQQKHTREAHTPT